MSQTVSGLLVLTQIIILLNNQSQLVLRTDKRYQHPLYSCLCHLTPLKICKISRKADSSVYRRHITQGCFAFRSFISYFYWILVVTVSFLWITAAPTCVRLQQMWNNPTMNVSVSCKSEMFDHRVCRPPVDWVLSKPLDMSGECRPLAAARTLKDCCDSFLLWFWVFQKDEKKKKALCTQDIWRERWENIRALRPVWKKTRC